MERLLDRLAARLTRLFDLDPVTARKVVEEVLDGLDQSADEYIVMRHAELQRLGWRNPRIFAQIQRELSSWRFRAPALTERQVRRRIYG